jgi:acetyl-CoA decarbonylase/synthase complex subunit delta
MSLEQLREHWSGAINTVSIGATAKEGGTRKNVVSVGGQTGLPFLHQESVTANRPITVFEIWDVDPDWPQILKKSYSLDLKDTLAWARTCQDKFCARALCLRLMGAHSDYGNKSPEELSALVKDLLKAVTLPLIIVGCGDDTKDNLVLPKIAEVGKGERLLLGSATQNNYKTLAVAALADGHSIIAESPIDINIAKQLNILISDMGLPSNRIVINPTVGALGYGLEYAYSIMERARLAALSGDTMLAMPFICFVGHESWRAKEAKATDEEVPLWGPQAERAVLWEALTASTFLQAGADILIMRHPQAIIEVEKMIDRLMAK